MSKQNGGLLHRFKEALFPKGYNKTNYDSYTQYGLRVEGDAWLSTRLDLEEQLFVEKGEAKDWDKKLSIEDKYVELISSYWGHGGDNPDYFRRLRSFKGLHGFYGMCRNVGLAENELIQEINSLEKMAALVRGASKMEAHVRANEPIVIVTAPNPYMTGGMGKNIQPFYRGKYEGST